MSGFFAKLFDNGRLEKDHPVALPIKDNRDPYDKYIDSLGIHPTTDITVTCNSIKTRQVHVIADESENKLYIITFFEYEKYEAVSIPFSSIIGWKAEEIGQHDSAVGRAIIGGMVAGGVGALVGASTARQHSLLNRFIIYTNDLKFPQRILPLWSNDIKAEKVAAQSAAQRLDALLNAIVIRNDQTDP